MAEFPSSGSPCVGENSVVVSTQDVDENKSDVVHQEDDVSAMIQALEDSALPLDLLEDKLKECSYSSIVASPLLLLGAKYNNVVSKFETMRQRNALLLAERKRMHNEIVEAKGNIRVICRCRPLNSEECSKGFSSVFEFDPVRDTELQILTSENSRKQFKLDHVFGPQGTQEDVFAEIKSMATSVLDGYNVCIFAYGQTGTGKTFTMEGTPGNRGVNYRTLEELFRVSGERNYLMKYEFFISALEVYNERIRDLLSENPNCPSKRLEIKQVGEGTHEIPGLVEEKASNFDGVWELFQAGARKRSVGATNANELSSRSHSLVRVTIRGENLINGARTKSHLWLVDLAGSERVGKIEVEGERLKESQFINKSLSALGDVIAALAAKNPYVPYRNSKLTHLLQSSLGGDCKTLMIVQVSPSSADVGETLCSLNFATRVGGIEQGPARKQADPAEAFRLKQMAEKLRQEEKERNRLTESLQTMNTKYASRESQLVHLKEKVKELENQLAQERKTKQARQEEANERSQPSKPPLPPTLPQRQPLGRISANLLPPLPPPARKSFLDWLPVSKPAEKTENNKPKLRAQRILVPAKSRRASVATMLPARTAQAPSSSLRIVRRKSSVMALPSNVAATPQRQVQEQGQRWRPSMIPALRSPCEGSKISFRIQKRLLVGSPVMKRSLAPTMIPGPAEVQGSVRRFAGAQRFPNFGSRRRSVL